MVAVVGAGGKSSAIRRVANELREANVPVLVATTTKMMLDEAEGMGPILTADDSPPGVLGAKVAETLAGEGVAVVGAARISKNRLGGLDPTFFPTIAPPDGVTLVEADGARHRSLKGTADYEPALPDGVTLVVAVGGTRALGEAVGEKHVHRPAVFSQITGAGPGHTITTQAFARALLAGFHNTPENSRRAALLTDVEPGPSMAEASAIGRQLWRGGVSKVVLTSLPGETPGRVWTL